MKVFDVAPQQVMTGGEHILRRALAVGGIEELKEPSGRLGGIVPAGPANREPGHMTSPPPGANGAGPPTTTTFTFFSPTFK